MFQGQNGKLFHRRMQCARNFTCFWGVNVFLLVKDTELEIRVEHKGRFTHKIESP